MERLLVLGLVPGTNIQITFLNWLSVASVVAVLLGLLYAKRRHVLMFLILAIRLRRRLAQIESHQLALSFSNLR